MHPLVLDAVRSVLGHATSFQLHLTQVIAIGPGEPAQPIHRDQWAFDFFPFPKGYEVQCNTIWAMTDFTEENGATRVIPGSHRFDDRLRVRRGDTVPAEMPKGSVLFYTGSALPRRAARTAREDDALRREHHLQLRAGCARRRTSTSRCRSTSRARCPVDLLRLMGYARGAYALGYVDDLRDPMDVVRPDLASNGLGDLEQAANRAREQLTG